MRFESPHLLWLLLVLPPAMIVFLAWAQRRKARQLALFVEARLLPTLIEGVSPIRQRWSQVLLAGALGCLILALARPQWGFTWEEARQRGLDIVVAIDTSKSMLAEDVAPNRLARAKLAVLDLMKQARTDRLGLVAFAGTAFLMCPLTMDDEAFRQSVNALDVNIIPQGGTALAPAIAAAEDAFKNDADNHKILVLFTDGEDHEEAAIAEAERAAKDGLRIFTIGLGSAEGELLRITDRRGRQEFIKDEGGNVVRSRLNESLLQEIAAKANGFYLPLRGAQTVEQLYEKGLAPLPKTEGEALRIKRYHERYQWPLTLAVLLLITEILLPARSRKRSPLPNGKTALATALSVLALLFSLSNARASSSSAQRDYQAGRYQEALKEYRQLQSRKPDDSRLNYNAGAAAYRDGQFSEAADQFSKAASAQDIQLQQQAYYNLGNTLFKLGEQLPENSPEGEANQTSGQLPKDRMEAWNKALFNFQCATNLNPKDVDAQHNYDYVQRKLEELKQQQEQQQQQDKQDQENKDDQSKDQPKDQKQDKKDQPSKDNQKQSDQDKKQDQQKPDSKKDQKKDQKDSTKPDQKPKPKDQSKEQQKQPSPGDQKDKQDKQPQSAEGGGESRPGQMTPEQVRQMLDAQRGDEELLRPVAPAGERPPAKDW